MSELSEKMNQLAETLMVMPSDVKVMAIVTCSINDDIPDGFVLDNAVGDGNYYVKVIEAKDGVVTQSIRLYMP